MPPVRSRRAEYTESTRDAVLDGAAELFVERGYPGTSLDEIAAAARVTKGAIYHHFANKAALMRALIERMELAENARMRALFADVAARDGAEAGARVVVDAVLERCSDPGYGTLVFKEAPQALGWRDWRACEERYAVAIIEEILGALSDAGAVRVPVTGTLVSIVLGMLGTAGQLLAEAAEADKPRVGAELRAAFYAFLIGLRAGV